MKSKSGRRKGARRAKLKRRYMKTDGEYKRRTRNKQKIRLRVGR